MSIDKGMRKLALRSVLGLTLFGTALLTPLHSWPAEIYRCTDGGKTTLQDHPCRTPDANATAGSPAPISAPQAATSSMQGLYGEWRGTIQTHGSAAGKPLPDEHALAGIVLVISPDGTFKGAATSLGCELLGLSSVPAGIPGTLRLDVTASGCKVAGFNGRYQGHLILQPHNEALFQLNAVYTQSLGVTVVTEIRGTLGR